MRWVVVSLLALGCAGAPVGPVLAPRGPAAPDPARRERLRELAPSIDELLHVRRAALGATGAALGVVLDGELVYVGGVGLRDAERGDRVGPDTVFRMASLTQGVTALAALKLRDEGELELDVPVGEYLPEVRWVGLAADAEPPSLRHLLTMTSGLPDDARWAALTSDLDAQALDALLGRGLTLASAPGERFAYSNLGYALVGRAIAAASGQGYREYVRERLLEPLGMRDTVWEASAAPPERLAIGYRRERDARLAPEHPGDGELAPAGGLYTTVRDFARYMAFQLAAYPPRGGPDAGPVRRSTLREMHAGQRAFRWGDEQPVARRTAGDRLALSAPSYGLGWVRQTTCDHDGIVQQGGAERGYFASARLLPREGLGVVVFSTTAPLADYQTFERLLGMLRAAGVLERASAPPAPALVEAADACTRLLAGWDEALAAESFDTPGSPGLERLRGDFEALSREHGACSRAGPLRSDEPTRARFRLACARGALELEVRLAPVLPSRIQAVHVEAELPPDARLERAARGLVRALSSWDEQADAVFAPGLDRRRLRHALAGLMLEHGTCSLASALWSDGEREARYRLSCARGALELGLRIDRESGAITRLTRSPASASSAPLCSEERVLAE